MFDLLSVALIVLFFFVAVAFVHACAALQREDD
jgi:hypothetical protein